MSLRPRLGVEGIKPCLHGGPNYVELSSLGIELDRVLDFSSSCNPFGPPKGVKEALGSILVERYPDPEATELKLRLSEKLGVNPAHILVGSGAVELIRLVALAYIERGEKVLIFEPTFGEYRVACQIMGAKIWETRAKEQERFKPNIDSALSLIRAIKPKGVFLCNPNNPTGQYLSRAEVEGILDELRDGFLVLDEAYVSFVEGAWASPELTSRGNLIIIRSLTKDFALPGLRLGYAIATPGIIAVLRRVRPPWNVNAAAQHAGLVALKNEGFLEQSKRRISEAKESLLEGLSQLGFLTLPSRANFFLVKVGNARRVRLSLLRRGILVRDCTSFGLPEYIRIAVRPLEECGIFITALMEIIEDTPGISCILE